MTDSAHTIACLGTLLVLLGLPQVPAAEPEPKEPGEKQFLTRTRQLTFDGRRSGEGYFAPDGKALIFQSEREPGNPFYQIYLLDLEEGETHRVSPGTGKTTCAFFQANQDRVLYASTHLDPEAVSKQKAELEFRASGKERRYSWDYDEHMDIFTANRDGSKVRRLTRSRGYDAEAAFSPDGSKIVFCSLRQAYEKDSLTAEQKKRLETDPAWFGEIYTMNADGSDVKRLTHQDGYDGGPFFSPDGSRIIWRHFSEDGLTADVYTMKTDGTDVKRLTDFKSMSWAPYYHPSGRYAIFTANKLGFSNFELYLVDIDGAKEPVRVTFKDGFDGLPVFSPDGTQLCWTSGRTPQGQSQLFLAQWNHQAALAALAKAGGRQSAPSDPAVAHGHDKPTSQEPDLLMGFHPHIRVNDLKRHVNYLASEELGGRMTGSQGNGVAADYIAGHLLNDALRPAHKHDTMFQPFKFTSDVKVTKEKNFLYIQSQSEEADPVSIGYKVDQDFRPLSFTANKRARGEVVFVGYGLTVPGDKEGAYDSYAGLNVSNKIVLALRYVPEDVEPKRRAELNRYAGLRYKAMLARERGAKAILFVTGPRSPNAGKLAGMSFDGSLAGSGIVAATVSSNVVAAIFKASGKDLGELQEALDMENPHAESGFVLKDIVLDMTAAVEQIEGEDRNILAYIPPSKGRPKEFVMIGAHFDHLGRGETGGAMRRAGEENMVHYGADDNASGVSLVMELASSLSLYRAQNPDKFKRGILVALWSGEELGLLGSAHFAENPSLPLTNIAAYLNFDMVGRMVDNKLNLQGVGSSSTWKRLIEKRNVAAGFDLTLQEDPYLPTDVTSFYPKKIPVLNFFTGSHEDYHRPTDTPDKLNYEDLLRTAKFAEGLLKDLVSGETPPEYVHVARSDTGGGRERLRVYLGTIPDYATDIQGVKLSGVRAGGPADKAGLASGDVIVEFAGQKIKNIYDYTYALDAVKIGRPTKIVVLRKGKRVELEITPGARN